MVGEITTDNQTASVDHQTRAFARLVDRTGDVQLPAGLAEVPIEIASTSEIYGEHDRRGDGVAGRFILDAGAPTVLDPSRIPGFAAPSVGSRRR